MCAPIAAQPHTHHQDGDRFWRMPEVYVRGNTIKYIRVPDEVIDMVKEETFRKDGAYRGGASANCIAPHCTTLHTMLHHRKAASAGRAWGTWARARWSWWARGRCVGGAQAVRDC